MLRRSVRAGHAARLPVGKRPLEWRERHRIARLTGSNSIYYAYLLAKGAETMKTAKVFKHGNSQAVRLPKEFRFAGEEVQIKRVGAGVLLLPTQVTYEQIMAVVGRFTRAIERQQPEDQVRQWR